MFKVSYRDIVSDVFFMSILFTLNIVNPGSSAFPSNFKHGIFYMMPTLAFNELNMAYNIITPFKRRNRKLQNCKEATASNLFTKELAMRG